MMDADHFQGFNDKHGHAAGDAVLKELGQLLTSQVRGADIACRYGGEEFTLILPDASAEDTCNRADALRRAAAALKLRLPDGETASITVSQGVAAYPEHGTSSTRLLRSADEALYRAKHSGRYRVALAVSETDVRAPVAAR